MRIGDLADLLSVSTKTIRHWQAVGLLAEPERSANGYRDYPAAAVVRALKVRQLRGAGLSLRRVAVVLSAVDYRSALGDELRGARADLEEAIDHLTLRVERISDALDARARELVTGRGAATTAAEHDAVLLAEIAALAWPEVVTMSLNRLMSDPRLAAAAKALGAEFDRRGDNSWHETPGVDRADEMVAVAVAGVPEVTVDAQLEAVVRALVRDRLSGADLPPGQLSLVRALMGAG